MLDSKCGSANLATTVLATSECIALLTRGDVFVKLECECEQRHGNIRGLRLTRDKTKLFQDEVTQLVHVSTST